MVDFRRLGHICGLQNEDDVYHIDDLWSYLATLKTPGSNEKEFDLLAKVTQYIMTILHSNARIFSLINKNKTLSRSHFRLITHYQSCLLSKHTLKIHCGGIPQNH